MICDSDYQKFRSVSERTLDIPEGRVKRGNLERFLTPINSSTACTPMDHWIYMKVTVHLK